MRDGSQNPFGEQIVDIHADVVVIERKIDRSRKDRNARFPSLMDATGRPARPAIEEYRPALLEKGEERFPVARQNLQRPFVESGILSKKGDEPFVKFFRNPKPAIMAPEKRPQEVRRPFDQLRRDVEDMPEDELLRRVLAQRTGRVALLRRMQGVEVPTVQRGHDRVAQVGKMSPG